MPHGYPDWGEGSIVSTIFRVMDLGELAARLGSIDTFHRGGNVLLLESFEDGSARWILAANGTGGASAICTDYVKDGAQAIKLTSGSDGALIASMATRLAVLVLSKLGLEWALNSAQEQGFFQVTLVIYTGTRGLSAGIRYNFNTNVLQYFSSGSTWETLASGVDLYAITPLFHVFKLVVDVEAKKYVRLIVNNVTYDIGEYDLADDADTTSPHAQIQMFNEGRAGENDIFRVDNVIITQNED